LYSIFSLSYNSNRYNCHSFIYIINLLLHEHIVKNGRFHWKASCYIFSWNCYETMKNASILMKLGTNVNWTIASVTACLILNFLLPWQWGDVSKLTKITIFALFFSIKTNFKVLQCFEIE
jgi:hypothetical protein